MCAIGRQPHPGVPERWQVREGSHRFAGDDGRRVGRDLAFSRDPQQQFVYVADGQDKKILVLRRDTLDVVSSVGQGGASSRHFYAVGSIAVDSKGNVYTGETSEGKRSRSSSTKDGTGLDPVDLESSGGVVGGDRL